MPKLGKTTVGASNNTPGPNTKEAHGPYTLPGPALIYGLNWYLRSQDPLDLVRNCEPLIYRDNGSGDPGALVILGPATLLSVPVDGWYQLPFTSPVYCDPGDIHIGAILDVASNRFYEAYDVNGGSLNRYQYSIDTYADGVTDPFGAPSGVLDWDVSIYADYELLQGLPSRANPAAFVEVRPH